MSKSCEANATTLKFPTEQDVDRKERVSYEAMDLINSLLQEREHRLCSKKYSVNDCQQRTHLTGQLTATRTEKPPQDYQGHYVYPDDAVDIKAHPFFHGLEWENIHLSRPPFVPDVRSQADTKYFDDDQVSEVDDGSSEQEPRDPSYSVGESGLEGNSAHNPNNHHSSSCQGDSHMQNKLMVQFGVNGPYVAGEKAARRKEKKRPRDRVLRDKQVGRQVLELRKRGAFLGYAYQRPATVVYDGMPGSETTAFKG
jgi:hypothetical protein